MKNIKKIIAAALLASASLSLCAQTNAVEPKKTPNFELQNKYGLIYITISNVVEGSEGYGNEAFFLGTKEKFQTTVDTTKPTNIVFWEGIGPTDPTSGNKMIGFYSIEPTKGKTVYVTFGQKDGKIQLYRQTGPRLGRTGKTESGLPLTNNIETKDIIEVLRYRWSRGIN